MMHPILAELLPAISERFCVPQSEIVAPGRHAKSAMRAYSALCWALRQRRLSLPEIGKIVGRDHSTVDSAIKRYPECLAEQEEIERHIEEVERAFVRRYEVCCIGKVEEAVCKEKESAPEEPQPWYVEWKKVG